MAWIEESGGQATGVRRLRPHTPSPANAAPTSVSDDGSGTAALVVVKHSIVALELQSPVESAECHITACRHDPLDRARRWGQFYGGVVGRWLEDRQAPHAMPARWAPARNRSRSAGRLYGSRSLRFGIEAPGLIALALSQASRASFIRPRLAQQDRAVGVRGNEVGVPLQRLGKDVQRLLPAVGQVVGVAEPETTAVRRRRILKPLFVDYSR